MRLTTDGLWLEVTGLNVTGLNVTGLIDDLLIQPLITDPTYVLYQCTEIHDRAAVSSSLLGSAGQYCLSWGPNR